ILSTSPKSRASNKSTTYKTACTASRPANSAKTACSHLWAMPSPRRASTAPSARARTMKATMWAGPRARSSIPLPRADRRWVVVLRTPGRVPVVWWAVCLAVGRS
ncbi:hypothetical protein N0V82_005904, partial [Gnomoniopsis sp. IMI 355080]